MKPETEAFLAKSRGLIDRAPALLAQNFTDDAGRAAYLAGFHAAQARQNLKDRNALLPDSGAVFHAADRRLVSFCGVESVARIN